MKVITAPHAHNKREGRISLFLAGGITNCPDWQSTAIDGLKGIDHLDILNPRRPIFPMNSPAEADIQISWEYRHLQSADIIIFWFCSETLCPIVLYELGYQLAKQPYTQKTKLFIGAHPEYQRREDVKIQTRLALEGHVRIYDNLDELVGQVRSYIA